MLWKVRKCPYCFEPVSSETVVFRCANESCDGKAEDAILKRFYDSFGCNLDTFREPVVPRRDSRSLLERVQARPGVGRCAECEVETSMLLCPSCHMEIPHGWTEAESKVIALVGTENSGKTNLLTVLLHQLQRDFPRIAEGIMYQLDEHSQDRFHKARVALFRDGIVPEKTDVVRQSREQVRFPFNLRLQWGSDRVRKTLNLAIYDMAGENFDDVKDIQRDARYIARADALMLLLDPLQLQRPVAELARGEALGWDTATQEGLARLTQVMKVERNLGLKKKLRIPLAVVVTKIDQLKSMLQSSPVYTLPVMTKGFDDVICQSISKGTEQLVGEWLGEGLSIFSAQEFRKVQYFAVSALGSQPIRERDPETDEETGVQKVRDRDVQPFRNLEPLMWLLREWGYM